MFDTGILVLVSFCLGGSTSWFVPFVGFQLSTMAGSFCGRWTNVFDFAASFILRGLEDYWQLWRCAEVASEHYLSIEHRPDRSGYEAILSETNHVHTSYSR